MYVKSDSLTYPSPTSVTGGAGLVAAVVAGGAVVVVAARVWVVEVATGDDVEVVSAVPAHATHTSEIRRVTATFRRFTIPLLKAPVPPNTCPGTTGTTGTVWQETVTQTARARAGESISAEYGAASGPRVEGGHPIGGRCRLRGEPARRIASTKPMSEMVANENH